MSDNEDETQEAAEILTDLLANQSLANATVTNRVVSANTDDSTNQPPANNDAEGTQVGEAQKAALQQLVSGNNVLNEKSVRALLDAMGGGSSEGETKHMFWDTQVSLSGHGT